jgi:hypothetical protein
MNNLSFSDQFYIAAALKEITNNAVKNDGYTVYTMSETLYLSEEQINAFNDFVKAFENRADALNEA